jgi:hypothetical protein
MGASGALSPMRKNRIPAADRVANRLAKLETRLASSRGPSGGDNPYWRCLGCGITDPARDIRGGHYKSCRYAGLEAEIRFWRAHLDRLRNPESTGAVS